MTARRLLPGLGMVLALLGAALAPVPASAQTTGSPEAVVWTVWEYPTQTAPPDAVGTWMYVVPPAAPAPGMASPNGYQYLAGAIFPGFRFAHFGLATRDDGTRVARLVLGDDHTVDTAGGRRSGL